MTMVALIGCSPSSYSDSVSTFPAGEGRYTVEAQGNKHTSAGQLRAFIEQKAGELCPVGYEVEGLTDSTSDQHVLVNRQTGQTKTNTSHDVTATVVCK